MFFFFVLCCSVILQSSPQANYNIFLIYNIWAFFTSISKKEMLMPVPGMQVHILYLVPIVLPVFTVFYSKPFQYHPLHAVVLLMPSMHGKD